MLLKTKYIKYVIVLLLCFGATHLFAQTPCDIKNRIGADGTGVIS